MQWVNERAFSDLLRLVSATACSSFYQKKFSGAGLETQNLDGTPITRVPFLTRAELVDTPVRERLYVPREDIRFSAFTSGTSAKKPLITLFADIEDYHFEPSLSLPVARPLIIYPPLNKMFGHTFMQQCRQADRPVAPVFGDYQNLNNSAFLAGELGCDSVYATPTIASLFAEPARKQKIAESVKLLALSSETLTRTRRAELTVAYPNALIANVYASSEIGQFVLFPCLSMMEKGENTFHLLTEALAAAELVDGELVVSYGLNRACPLVRYRTGDYFEEKPEGCPCGLKGPVLQWSRREEVDRARINGVEFDVEESDRVFASLPNLPPLDYQVHFKEGDKGVGIEIEIKEALSVQDEALAEHLASRVASSLPDLWRISATATLRTALERGLFEGLRVRVVSTHSHAGNKTRRFVSHLS